MGAEERQERQVVGRPVQLKVHSRVDERPPVLLVRSCQQRDLGLDVAVLVRQVRVERDLVIAVGWHPRQDVVDGLWQRDDGDVLLDLDQGLELLGSEALGDPGGVHAARVLHELPVVLVVLAILVERQPERAALDHGAVEESL